MSVAFGEGGDPSPVCNVGETHSGVVDSFSGASVSIWYLRRSSAEPDIECHFWCSGNGTAFEVGPPLAGPIDEEALQSVVSGQSTFLVPKSPYLAYISMKNPSGRNRVEITLQYIED